MVELNPDQFFHGTTANLKVGDSLLPTSKTGVEPNHDMSWDKAVYMTGDENNAWDWAGYSMGGHKGTVRARPWVGRVEPSGEVADDGYEATAPSAKIMDRRDVQPGRQATFPSLNWNQFAKPHLEVNHPSDEEILGGHDAYARKYRPGLYEPPEPDLNSPERRFEYDPADPDPGQKELF